MREWLRHLDDLLRGNRTQAEQLDSGTSQLPAVPYFWLSLVLGALYGACAGLFSVLNHADPAPLQVLSSAIKMPFIFYLTLLVTLPSLYVFSALIQVPLRLVDIVRVSVAGVTISLTVLASFAPIVAFFNFSTTSYAFMKLLNVGFCAVAAMLGLVFLLKILIRLDERRRTGGGDTRPLPPVPGSAAGEPAPDDLQQDGGGAEGGPQEPASPANGDLEAQSESRLRRAEEVWQYREHMRHRRETAAARRLFFLWSLLFALVGAQMAWLVRPLIGDPDDKFMWFAERGGNFFADVLDALGKLFGG